MSFIKKYLPITLIAGLAAALRLAVLFHYGDFWADEMFSVVYSQKPWLDSLTKFWVWETNPPLHMLILKLWFYIFPVAEWSARLPSVLFGAGGVVALYFFTRRFVDSRAAFLSSFFYALLATNNFFSATARTYSLLLFLVIVSTYLHFTIFLEKKRGAGLYAAYAVVQTLLLYSHFTALTIIFCQFLITALTKERKKEQLKLWTRLNFFPGALWLAWAVPSLSFKAASGAFHTAWVLNLQRDWLMTVGELRLLFVGPTYWLLGAAAIILYIGGVILYWRRPPKENREAIYYLFLLAIFPMVAPALVGFWLVKFMMVALPWLAVTIACVLQKFFKPALAAALIALLLLPGNYALWRILPINDWDQLNEQLSARYDPRRKQIFTATNLSFTLEIMRYYHGPIRFVPYYPPLEPAVWDYYFIRKCYLATVLDEKEERTAEQWLKFMRFNDYDDIFVLYDPQLRVELPSIRKIGWYLQEQPPVLHILNSPRLMHYVKKPNRPQLRDNPQK